MENSPVIQSLVEQIRTTAKNIQDLSPQKVTLLSLLTLKDAIISLEAAHNNLVEKVKDIVIEVI